jgi:hypothetical protein
MALDIVRVDSVQRAAAILAAEKDTRFLGGHQRGRRAG